MKVKQFFQSLSIIHKGMLAGILLLLLVLKFVVFGTIEEVMFGETVETVVMLFAVLLVAGAIYYFKSNCDRLREEQSLLKKLEGYRTFFIIHLAMIEAAVIVSIIFWVLNGKDSFLYLALAILVFMITRNPSKQNVYKMVFAHDGSHTALEDDEKILK